MRSIDWLQLLVFIAGLALITKPMGLFLMQVLDAEGRTWFDPILKPLERLTYWIMGVKPKQEQDWKRYTFSMLLFSLTGSPVYLRHTEVAAFAAAQSARLWPIKPGSGLQYGNEFYHQYQLAELQR